MANYSSARTALINFLQENVYIDAWDIDAPRHYQSENVAGKQACTGVLYPPKNVRTQLSGTNSVTATADVDFSLTYKYPKELTYHQLPLASLSSLSERLRVTAITQLGGCKDSGIRQVTTDTLEYPLVITRSEEFESDWLVTLNISFILDYTISELDDIGNLAPPLEGYEPVVLNSVKWDIYRASVGDLSDNVLDRQYIKDTQA
jgi:hypothetical protein